MEAKEFNANAMLEWCARELLPGVTLFRETNTMLTALGVNRIEDLDKADYFSLGYSAAIGMLSGMFEGGAELDKLAIADNMTKAYKECLREMEQRDED